MRLRVLARATAAAVVGSVHSPGNAFVAHVFPRFVLARRTGTDW